MKRIKLTIEYDGSQYSGWQKQPNQKTIQGEIEEAIFRAIGQNVSVFGSGRTDAGVHAYNQTAHFDLGVPVPVSKLKDILNSVLPLDITIKDAIEVNNDFHARFSIKRKTYLYKIYNGEEKKSFLASRMAHVKKPLDEQKMQEIANLLIGCHDFRGFCSANTCVTDFVREIFDIKVQREENYIFVTVTGNGFLYNMVRIIVGTLVDFSFDKLTLEDVKIALEKGERAKSGQTMPPFGLYLKETIY